MTAPAIFRAGGAWWRPAGPGLFMTALALGGVALALGKSVDGRVVGLEGRVVGGLAALLFGLAALVYLGRAARLLGDVVVVSPDGVLDKRWLDAPLAWSRVAAMRETAFEGQPGILVELFADPPPPWWGKRFWRGTWWGDQLSRSTSFVIDSRDLRADAAALTAALADHAAHWAETRPR